ncbi:hypothetical protein JG687_00014402 [Phytophthora cactorum]|uniref:Uncharacterized protein n=1 Tax=Phytophthora cactorum TaxID=29920 RepID=A0A329RFW7_9STRA|nr:hypothetical protein Pcac1_g4958 [Phytophthora cactorum]KAG2815536.1 hypothetical protein PC112_g13843 [Phytophthora cactorum]KAG2827011.1 hypothetical protein PC111_g8745 [Phytophthora cactorum]KAG2853492.1 hypothetical protein PC113_g14132 [Phytophthora cactorum]KAG2896642.1 hypothetical protein PC114_g15005 [Phytophthora cactorum]
MLFDSNNFDALGRALFVFKPGGANALIAAVQEDEKLKKALKGCSDSNTDFSAGWKLVDGNYKVLH